MGQRARLLLGEFEAGGERKPFKGKSVAVPITGGPARPTFESPVLEALRFKALRFRRAPGSRGGKKRYVGTLRTYIVPEVGVFQREGPGQSKLVYSFEKDVRLKPSLGFVDTAQRVADVWFPHFMDKAIAEALRRGR